MEDSSKMEETDARVARFGPFRYEFAAGRLLRDNEELPLPPRGHAVLRVLLERAGALVDKPTLLAAAWNGTSVTEGSLSEAVRLIRRALADEAVPGTYIQTVPRRGYRFAADVSWQPRAANTSAPRVIVPVRWQLAATLGLLAALGWLLFVGGDDDRAPPRARFTLDLTDLGHLHLKGQPSVAVSPDGTMLAMVLERNGVRRIHVRSLDHDAAAPLARSEGAVAPFFSPDGSTLAFFADGRLKIAALETGAVVDAAAAPEPHGGVWTADDAIVFASAGRLQRIEPGRAEERRAIASARDWAWRWPDVLPDGRLIATRWRGSLESADIAVIQRDGSVAPFIEHASHAHPAGDHIIYFARNGRLFRTAPVDSRSPERVEAGDRIATDPFTGAAQFAASAAGVLVYAAGEPEAVGRSVLQWVRDDGGRPTVAFGPARVKTARLAPDERRMLVTLADGATTDVWIAGPESERLQRLSHDGRSTGGVWAPDGRHVAFARLVGDRFVAMIAPADGGEARVLWSAAESTFPYSWAPSGNAIAAETYRAATGWDVDVLDIDLNRGNTGARSLLAATADERFPRFSPRGRWIAYQSNASGRWEVYIANADGRLARQISRGGGEWPIWRGTDRLLYTADGLLWSADLEVSDAAPRAMRVRPLLPLRDLIVAEAAADGLLALARVPDAAGSGLHVVLAGR